MYSMHEALARDRMCERAQRAEQERLSAELANANRSRARARRARAAYLRHSRRAERSAQAAQVTLAAQTR